MTRTFEYTGFLAAAVLLVAAPAFALGSGLEATSVHTLTSDRQAHLDKGDLLFSSSEQPAVGHLNARKHAPGVESRQSLLRDSAGGQFLPPPARA